jgi:hypothetical protein
MANTNRRTRSVASKIKAGARVRFDDFAHHHPVAGQLLDVLGPACGCGDQVVIRVPSSTTWKLLGVSSEGGEVSVP